MQGQTKETIKDDLTQVESDFRPGVRLNNRKRY